jgi:two-component sensor histidine kinase/ABC-type amino acid transport substrate-binding protein
MILACATLSISPTCAQPAVAASGGLTLSIGYNDAKPSSWHDEAGLPHGIFLETLEAIAEAEGWTISWIFADWDTLLSGLKSGTLDIVPAIVRTPSREEFAASTEESIMTDWGHVYTRANGGIRSVLDLEGKRVGALENDFWFSVDGSLRDLASGFGITPVYVYFKDYSSMFAALSQGEIDAADASNSLGIVWQPLLPIVPSPLLYNPIELRLAMSRTAPGAAALAARLDDALLALRPRSPEVIQNILEKYQVPVKKEYQTPEWVIIALAILVAVLSAAMVFMVIQTMALCKSNAKAAVAAASLGIAKEKLEHLLGEKELLVHEPSHRVKNNLQIILSLVRLVGGDDESGPLFEVREKVYSIAMIEEELHAHGELDEELLRSFFEALAGRLADHSSGPPGFDVISSAGLGYRLINALVSQLGGRLSATTDGGAEVSIELPASMRAVRA